MSADRILRFVLAGAGLIAVTAALWTFFPLFDVTVSTTGIYGRPEGSLWGDVRFSDVPGYLTVFFAVVAVSVGGVSHFRTPSREFVIWCFILSLVPTIVSLLGYFGMMEFLKTQPISFCEPPGDPYPLTPNKIMGSLKVAAVRVHIGIAASALSIPLLAFALFRARQKANRVRGGD